jgi:hypothetical protein
MSAEVLAEIRAKMAELCKMIDEDEDQAREAGRRAPVWAHWIRCRIQLAKEIDMMLSALKLEAAKGA